MGWIVMVIQQNPTHHPSASFTSPFTPFFYFQFIQKQIYEKSSSRYTHVLHAYMYVPLLLHSTNFCSIQWTSKSTQVILSHCMYSTQSFKYFYFFSWFHSDFFTGITVPKATRTYHKPLCCIPYFRDIVLMNEFCDFQIALHWIPPHLNSFFAIGLCDFIYG